MTAQLTERGYSAQDYAKEDHRRRITPPTPKVLEKNTTAAEDWVVPTTAKKRIRLKKPWIQSDADTGKVVVTVRWKTSGVVIRKFILTSTQPYAGGGPWEGEPGDTVEVLQSATVNVYYNCDYDEMD